MKKVDNYFVGITIKKEDFSLPNARNLEGEENFLKIFVALFP